MACKKPTTSAHQFSHIKVGLAGTMAVMEVIKSGNGRAVYRRRSVNR